jgi:arabinofuranosyltransferase
MVPPATPGSWDRQRRVLLVFVAVVFTYVFLANSWVGDDAYITFRVSDNLIHGFGARWNVAERVQVYTNPLWMLLMAGASLVSGEFFYTSLVISLALCLAAVLTGVIALRGGAKGWLLFALLLSSKAFIDYTSSGLEYPLGYLLLAVFVVRLRVPDRRGVDDSSRRLVETVAIASLAFLNRADTLLLYLPAIAWLIWRHARKADWRLAARILAASAPAWGWLVFALVYYGFPFPNTYYAKVATGAPRWLQIQQGLAYTANSLRFDPITLGTIAVALGLSWTLKSVRVLVVGIGALAYVGYTMWVGADFMAGRFFSLPFLAAAMMVAESAQSRRAALAGIAALLAFNLINPLAPVKTGAFYEMGWPWRLQNGIKDERGGYHRATNVLLFEPFTALPDHQWVREGKSLRASSDPVAVRPSIGFIGFFAGPAKYVIDINALTDPLLARLPMSAAIYFDFWTSHYDRPIPEGYIESRRDGKNLLTDPLIREYFDELLLVTTGPVFSGRRARAIWDLNWGRYRRFQDLVTAARPLDIGVRAGGRRFQTDVGEVDGDKFVRTTGRAGYLLLGPRMQLQAGEYQVRWTGTTEAPGTPVDGWAEVCVNQCRNRIGRTLLVAPAEANGIVGELAFRLAKEADDVEFRVYTEAGTALRLQHVRLTRK